MFLVRGGHDGRWMYALDSGFWTLESALISVLVSREEESR